MLEGKNVNLRVVEKEVLSLLAEWFNNLEFWGEYDFLQQMSRTEIEKTFENNPLELKQFIVEKKDGSKIGGICHFNMLHLGMRLLEIGYVLLPSARDCASLSLDQKI